jgi:hypothetical protein
MNGYLNFNRHNLFNVGDMLLVRQLIDKVYMNDNTDRDLVNKLYGLFDGYLYDDLMQSSAFQLPTTDLMDLRKLVDKIKSDIAKNGQSFTQV